MLNRYARNYLKRGKGDKARIAEIIAQQEAREAKPRVATDRAEDEPCQRGTDGCCIDHVTGEESSCQTW